MSHQKDPLDIEWWESPVTGRFDWDTLLFPIGLTVSLIVGAITYIAGWWPSR